jgi:hypothetical protein
MSKLFCAQSSLDLHLSILTRSSGRLMVFVWKDNSFVPIAITEDNASGHVSTIRSFLWNVNVRSRKILESVLTYLLTLL